MSVGIGVTVNGLDASRAYLQRAQKDLPRALDRGLARVGLVALQRLQAHFTGAEQRDAFWGKRGASGAFLGRRTGGTVQRLTSSAVQHAGDTAVIGVGSPDPYVKALDKGGGFSGRFRIPTAAAQTSAGVDRGLGLRGAALKALFPGSFYMRSKAGNLWLVQRFKGKGRSLVPLYLYKDAIHFPARGMFAAARSEVEPRAAAIVGDEVRVTVAA